MLCWSVRFRPLLLTFKECFGRLQLLCYDENNFLVAFLVPFPPVPLNTVPFRSVLLRSILFRSVPSCSVIPIPFRPVRCIPVCSLPCCPIFQCRNGHADWNEEFEDDAGQGLQALTNGKKARFGIDSCRFVLLLLFRCGNSDSDQIEKYAGTKTWWITPVKGCRI